MRHRHTPVSLLTSLALTAGFAAAVATPSAAAAAAPDDPGSGPSVYVGDLTVRQVGDLRRAGFDREDFTTTGDSAGRGKVGVEVVMTAEEAAKLAAQGLPLAEKRIDGEPVSSLLAQADEPSVFRSYSEPGGIRDELRQVAGENPSLTKLVTIGTTIQGQPLYAIKVTRGARQVRDGSRPAVLYSAAQHAREWITPEMNLRLLHHVVDGYASDPDIRRLLRGTELWFVPVANPDGYDYTFTEGNRLWRKNLRDNNGDAQITGIDGVDLNRNWPTRWGYDNEGSSPSYASQTYRGTAPASEPETRALDGLMRRVGFEFQVNYHSAAELLLYGVGWQVATRSPDDLIFEAQAGDDEDPAIPGYDPDQSAELYTTNGETTEHAHNTYGTLAYTPEMSTCQTASDADPDDAFEAADCQSVFNFPDSEPLVQAEFEKNLPFALAVADSADDPDHPVSPVGRRAPDFEIDSFEVSYGDPQTVAVLARRELRGLVLRYSINGRRPQTTGTRLWRGGERYGDEGTTYYGEFRGQVRGARPGDRVRVWFEATRPGKAGAKRGKGGSKTTGKRTTSRSFTYRLAQDTRNKVVVIAGEDYDGVNPTYDPPLTEPKYAETYVRALRRAGIGASVWDVSRQGVPHHLGVLSHFRGAVWYQGDNRLTQDPEDEITETYFGDLPDASVAEREQYLTLAVRDFLNEGGKLVHTGETATYYGSIGDALGGIYYGLNGDPSAPCEVVDDPRGDCLLLADDFAQYYLGRYTRTTTENPSGFAGAGPLEGVAATFGGPALEANPLDEAGVFTATSAVLPVEDFPQFASTTAGRYTGTPPGRLDPVEGEWYVGGLHSDDSYMRLTRQVDLSGVAAGDAPTLQARLSFDLEEGYDHAIVEARTVGQDDWTTLPETGGLTSTTVPTECEAGFLLETHPFLLHYLTPGDPCTPTGTTGEWNSMTGDSAADGGDGWQEASFDLSAYAGSQVEVSISYVTDPGTGGTGLFIDDTRLSVGGQVVDSEGFETGLGPWAFADVPPGSSPGTGQFTRSQSLYSPAVRTRDTVLLGFGVEQVASAAEQSALLRRAFGSVGLR
ncbi:M14 family metallopeptidase [Nocardioides ochotonae]|uniref:M14 family metallopeptidase n=1 Tax=Nocardioides ochotonae TaxID=2685869 RepID=UPI00140BC311|nr:M14 family metallopeptidase [Nocardioides ochotonae]